MAVVVYVTPIAYRDEKKKIKLRKQSCTDTKQCQIRDRSLEKVKDPQHAAFHPFTHQASRF